jgi:hypothetical protein
MSRLRLSYQTNKQRGQTLFGRYLLRRAADVHVPFGNAGVGAQNSHACDERWCPGNFVKN